LVRRAINAREVLELVQAVLINVFTITIVGILTRANISF
jgi:hypothetical protein